MFMLNSISNPGSNSDSNSMSNEDHNNQTPAVAAQSTTTPSTTTSSTTSTQLKSVWGWFEQASSHAKDLVSQAQNVATELSKQALELKENYDAEIQKSMMLSNLEKPPTNKMLIPRESTRLEEIDLVYITGNIIGMGFPHDPRKEMNIKGNRIDDVAGYLQAHHNSRYMIWNISEESYDYSLFGDQVLEYKFPGHPAPPLGLMFKICSSIESWLDADERNIAIVHCLTGKGRTAVVLACALTWIGEFNSPMEALTYITERKNSSIDILTIPSQRRYIQYFSNVLDGVRPRGEPLLLRRVIMNGIPKYGENKSNNSPGCCPYIQLFKNGKILANGLIASLSSSSSSSSSTSTTTTPSLSNDSSEDENSIRWLNCSEESASFQIDCIVQGDLLLRCRHHDPSTGARISMFRAAFHTGYVSGGVLRLTKAQLDGPNHDDRYNSDFFIDLIFASVEKQSDSQLLNQQSGSGTNGSGSGSLNDSGATLDHSITDKFEQMFHRDTRFWETIAARKLKTKRRVSRKFQSDVSEKFSILDDGLSNKNKNSSGSGSSSNLKKNSDFDLDDGDEIHFSHNSQTSSLSADIMFLSGPSTSELSDDELIKQLAEAADNVDLDYTTTTTTTATTTTINPEKNGLNDFQKISSSSSSSSSSSHNQNTRQEFEETTHLQEFPKTTDDPSSLLSPPLSSVASSSSSIKPVQIQMQQTQTQIQPSSSSSATSSLSSARAELQALEDLEKELGLDLGSSTITNTNTSMNKSTSLGNNQSDDNLDDIEDFLESLNK